MDRRLNGKVPVIFGRYQRNALTLKQILFQEVILTIFYLRNPLIVGFSIDPDLARPLVFVSNLIINNLLMDFLFPIYALYILKKNVPKFFQANSCEVVRSTPFFVRNPKIQPRVDFGHDWEWTARYNDNYEDEKGRPSTSKKMSHDG